MRNVVKSVEVRYYSYSDGLTPLLIVEFEDGTFGGASVQQIYPPTTHKERIQGYERSEPLDKAVMVVQERAIQDLKDRAEQAQRVIDETSAWIQAQGGRDGHVGV